MDFEQWLGQVGLSSIDPVHTFSKTNQFGKVDLGNRYSELGKIPEQMVFPYPPYLMGRSELSVKVVLWKIILKVKGPWLFLPGQR